MGPQPLPGCYNAYTDYSIFANLFVIEIVNIFLFLGLYIAIKIVVMMASISSDPIRRASESE